MMVTGDDTLGRQCGLLEVGGSLRQRNDTVWHTGVCFGRGRGNKRQVSPWEVAGVWL